MRTNTTKQKLQAGKVVYGAIVGEDAPGLVEYCGAIGFDFVFLDGEHGAIEPAQMENLCRAAEAFNVTPIARVPNGQASTLLRYLDRGVQGVIVPHCNTAEQAAAIADACRYYPDGHRGAAGGRAHDHGNVSRAESHAWINDNVLVIPMIEEVEAVKNLDEIVKVPGVDVLHCAASDLSQSMGHPAQAEVRKTMREVVTKVSAAGKWAGIGGNNPTDVDGVVELVAAGARFVTIQAWGLFRLGTDQWKHGVEAGLKAAGKGEVI
jgi:2-keto-3-deoxy-L-rhamnonate aldolase RhmA